MTPLETSLAMILAAALSGAVVKIWERRGSVSPEECRERHAQENDRYDRLERKVDRQTRMLQSLVTHTIEDPQKQEEILNENWDRRGGLND